MTNKNRYTTYLNSIISDKLKKDCNIQKRSASNMIEIILEIYYNDLDKNCKLNKLDINIEKQNENII
jgi:hypothetical protein